MVRLKEKIRQSIYFLSVEVGLCFERKLADEYFLLFLNE